ncbi:unnamed protein product [Dracunculus medinensis]|uniref:Ovule protein n=1 Tax=Dracunculus medinensis TaxID=318479 RepID=A0A0N4U2S4_DRAME|nr:unnamed protein product [Dracunculus medinensis]
MEKAVENMWASSVCAGAEMQTYGLAITRLKSLLTISMSGDRTSWLFTTISATVRLIYESIPVMMTLGDNSINVDSI